MTKMRAVAAALGLVCILACYARSETMIDAVGAAKHNATRFYSDSVLLESVKSGAQQAAAAKASMDAVNSQPFQEKIEKERQRLQTEIFGSPAKRHQAYYSDGEKEGSAKPHLSSNERIYLFVSSSMPDATLRAYVHDIAQLHDPNISIVMRGFIGGIQHAMPTTQFMQDLLKKDPRCTGSNCPAYEASFQLDPNLYRRFKPEKVPALVYVRGVNPVDPDASEGIEGNVHAPADSSWWMIYGDASMSYLLSRIAEDAKAPGVAALANVLKNNPNSTED